MPILITPGAFTRSTSFERLAERLEAEVVTLPRRPIAQLDMGGLRSLSNCLDEAIRLAPDDGTPLVLIGHSMGGLLSYRAGLIHHIDGQVLLMPAPPEGLALDIVKLAMRNPVAAAKLAALSLSTLPARFGSMTPPPGLYTAEATRDILDAAKVHRADESMSALLQLLIGSRVPVQKATVPTLVVGGSQDGLVPPARVHRFAERLGADHLELDVAHNFSEEPAGVVVDEAVEVWLRERSLLETVHAP